MRFLLDRSKQRRGTRRGRIRRAGAVAVRLGATLYPGRMAGPGADGWRPQPVPTGQLEELVVGIGAAIDAVGGNFTMEFATVVVTAAH
jgi:hypothetical protein